MVTFSLRIPKRMIIQKPKVNKQTNKTFLNVSSLFSLVSVITYLATFSVSNNYVASSVTIINDS